MNNKTLNIKNLKELYHLIIENKMLLINNNLLLTVLIKLFYQNK
jgi:hypothetical protein